MKDDDLVPPVSELAQPIEGERRESAWRFVGGSAPEIEFRLDGGRRPDPD